MKIFPKCSIKKLSECEPGQIVRGISRGDEGKFALVSSVVEAESKALILLGGDDGPLFEVVHNPKQWKILAFEGEAVWEIDQQGPFEPPHNALFQQVGSIVRTARGWMMNVKAESPMYQPRRRLYDIGNFTLQPREDELNDVAVFGAWALYLHDQERPFSERILIARFPHSEEEAVAE